MKEGLGRALYGAYYAFEALTDMDPESTLCGICGSIPDVLLGDGNEDLSIKLPSKTLDIDNETDSISEETVDDIELSLKKYIVGFLVFPWEHQRLKMPQYQIGQLPPIINPLCRYNIIQYL